MSYHLFQFHSYCNEVVKNAYLNQRLETKHLENFGCLFIGERKWKLSCKKAGCQGLLDTEHFSRN